MYSFDYKTFKALNPFVKNKDIAEYLGVTEGYISKVINGQTQLSEEKFKQLLAHPEWNTAPLLGRAQAEKPTYEHPLNLSPTEKPSGDSPTAEPTSTLSATEPVCNPSTEDMTPLEAGIPLVPTVIVTDPEQSIEEYMITSEDFERLNLGAILNNKNVWARQVHTREMYPLMNESYYYFVQPMPKTHHIHSGMVYLIEANDKAAVFRRLFDEGDHYRCVAANKDWPEYIEPKSNVRRIFEIKGLFSSYLSVDRQLLSLVDQLHDAADRIKATEEKAATEAAHYQKTIERLMKELESAGVRTDNLIDMLGNERKK